MRSTSDTIATFVPNQISNAPPISANAIKHTSAKIKIFAAILYESGTPNHFEKRYKMALPTKSPIKKTQRAVAITNKNPMW